jgi:polyisoprenoid-binding protein YceI
VTEGHGRTVPTTRYEIDSEATTVWIDARSSLHPIHSETHGLRGWFAGEVDEDGSISLSDPPQASLELPIEVVSSGNPLYDREMRRRVDARRFPTIDVVMRGLREGDGPRRYVAEGDVTFRGVTKRVEGTVSVSRDGAGTLVFEGEHVFQLPDFGMQPPKIMMLKVYPDVTVRVRIVVKEAS